MRTYYIYRAINKINGKSYIGETVNFEERRKQHEACYEKEDCLFHDALKEFGIDSFEWEILETCNNKEKALNLERQYIQKYDSYRNGYNSNKGGVGGHNARPIVCLNTKGEFVKRYDNSYEAHKDGFTQTAVLLCCKNKAHTSKNHVFMFESDYIKNGPKKYKKLESTCRKAVIQCDLQGNFIQKFESLQEASTITGAKRTCISNVLTKKIKSANNFIFVHEQDFPIKDLQSYQKCKKGKKIAQVDKNGNIIKVFERISDAGKELGVNYKTIHKVIDKPTRTAFGYKWISQ